MRAGLAVPSALARSCSVLGCGKSVPCPEHSAQRKNTGRPRQSASQQGYGARWRAFREWHKGECFRLMVPRAGLCGARLPGAPITPDSVCMQQGLVVLPRVLDHIKPVSGPDDPLFFDVTNLQWLCDGVTGRGCHDIKRQREVRR